MSTRLRRMWIQLTADRRRFGILCVMVVIGLLLWSRLIVVSQPPRTAVADDQAAVVGGAGAGRGVSDLTAGGGASGATGADNAGVRGAGTAAGLGAVRTPIRVELVSKPSHDPFVIDPLYFPKPTPSENSTQHASKSPPEPTEEPLQIEARLNAQLRSLVEHLKLEASIGTSMAVISGRTYRLGDVVPSKAGSSYQFTLREVRQRSVILECQGRLFELHMASPGT